MANNVEHIFICLSTIYISTVEKCLFKSFFHLFKLGYWSFYYLLVEFLYILYTSTLSDLTIYKYFLPLCGLSFFFLCSVLWKINILNFDDIQVIIHFVPCTFGIKPNRRLCLIQDRKKFTPVFVPKTYVMNSYIKVCDAFRVSFCLTQGRNTTSFFYIGYPVVPTLFVKKITFPSLNYLGTSVKIN